MSEQIFLQVSEDFFVDEEFAAAFEQQGLVSIDSIFDFSGGTELVKSNISKYRTRMTFDITGPDTTLFLKRYDNPPILDQVKRWTQGGRRQSIADFDRLPAEILNEAGIKTPKTIAYGSQFKGMFERRSFIVTEKIPAAESIERKLPDFILEPSAPQAARAKRDFINALADFVRKFHETGYFHRDLYFAHIFFGENGEFYLIDLQRTFKPKASAFKYRVKDIAQLYYSAPGNYFSRADRLRFYLRYAGLSTLTASDRFFIRLVKSKAWRIAEHDMRHGRQVPFAM
ncbi:MAG TPA: hypothetical protein ENH94_04150 [Phycisphaerales bacterium]|nr:hypothetical protein [Phycisphaerales bacterium]